jgi:hypothetical protein
MPAYQAGMPSSSPADAKAVIRALAEQLEVLHGMRRMYARGDRTVAVLSVCTGMTVWCFAGRRLVWAEDDERITWAATDIYGALARIAARCRELAEEPDRP